MRAEQPHDIIIGTGAQRHIGKDIIAAGVGGVAHRHQPVVAVEFGIPAARQRPAQLDLVEQVGAPGRAVGDDDPAAAAGDADQWLGRGVDIADGKAAGVEEAELVGGFAVAAECDADAGLAAAVPGQPGARRHAGEIGDEFGLAGGKAAAAADFAGQREVDGRQAGKAPGVGDARELRPRRLGTAQRLGAARGAIEPRDDRQRLGRLDADAQIGFVMADGDRQQPGKGRHGETRALG